MSLCNLCLAQVDRPGHFPPHSRSAKTGLMRSATGQNALVYQCKVCGHVLLLAAVDQDAPDRWILGGEDARP